MQTLGASAEESRSVTWRGDLTRRGIKTWRPTPKELDREVERTERIKLELLRGINSSMDTETRYWAEQGLANRETKVRLALLREAHRMEARGIQPVGTPAERAIHASKHADEVRAVLDRMEEQEREARAARAAKLALAATLKGGEMEKVRQAEERKRQKELREERMEEARALQHRLLVEERRARRVAGGDAGAAIIHAATRRQSMAMSGDDVCIRVVRLEPQPAHTARKPHTAGAHRLRCSAPTTCG